MTANWSDDTGPAYSKYLSNIPMDRLNKAPMITINKFSNKEYNSVSVRLAQMEADVGAGDSLKAGIEIDDEPAPPVSVWGKYYDPATVHEAPFISLNGSSRMPYEKHSISIVQTTAPLSISTAKEILGGTPPDPALYESRYSDYLNKAPVVTICYGDSDETSRVAIESIPQPLNIPAAEAILSQYRS